MGLEQYQGDMAMCCRCSCCKFVPLQMVNGFQYARQCPSVSRYNFHSYSGGGRLNIAAAMLKDGFDYTEKLLDVVYNCQLCGGCGASCNYAMDMEVLEPIAQFRIKCVEDGKTHPALDKAVGLLRTKGSMAAVDGKRGDWASGLNLKDYTKEKVDVVYHVGCKTSYDKGMWKLAANVAAIFGKAGVSFGIGGENEACCGGRAYQMGYKQDFLNQARKNMETIAKSGAGTLVTGCADCYNAFKVLYDQYGLKGNLEVLHVSEYIDRLIKNDRLKARNDLNLTVTYHDPCRLGRLGEPWIHWEGKRSRETGSFSTRRKHTGEARTASMSRRGISSRASPA